MIHSLIGKATVFVLALVMASMAQYSLGQTSAQQGATAGAKAATKVASSSTLKSEPAEQAADVRSGTKIAAELMSAVDARTAKPGDEVEAKVTKNVKQNGEVVVHKGDRLIGHVTDVQTGDTANAGSRMAVKFDHLMSGASTFRLNSALASVFSARSEGSAEGGAIAPEPAPITMPAPGGGSGGGGLLGGATSSVGSTASSTLGAAGSVAGSAGNTLGRTAGAAGHSATNVAGSASGSHTQKGGLVAPLGAIHLSSEAQGSQEAGASSVLSTKHGDLRLDSGTRMEFRVSGQADAQTDAAKKN